MEIRNWLQQIKPVIGMVHLLPLPGSPRWQGSMDQVLERAGQDARRYRDAGFHAVLVENYGDVPFASGRVEPHTVAAMAWLISHLKTEIPLPFGVNVLRNDWQSALALASICGCAFIRVNVLAGTMYTDQGPISGRAAAVARLRAGLCPSVSILADVFVKHALPPPGLTLEQAAADTWLRGGADGLIVTGTATGRETSLDDLRRVREAVPGAPLYAGSGVTAESVAAVLGAADGVVVGTALKRDGRVSNPVDPARAAALVAAARV